MFSMVEEEHPDITRMNRFGELQEDIPKYICDDCDCGIFEGDRYWEIEDELYCERCAEEMFSKLA